MSKYEKAELKLNEYPDPTNFHDMSVVNMKFLNDSIHIRFNLAKYMDDFGILEDDEHLAILDVIYNGVKINKINLEGLIDFRASKVYLLKEENGIVSLNLHNETFYFYFYLEFSYSCYKWSVKDVILVDEYYKYSDSLNERVDEIIKIQEIDTPDWSKI